MLALAAVPSAWRTSRVKGGKDGWVGVVLPASQQRTRRRGHGRSGNVGRNGEVNRAGGAQHHPQHPVNLVAGGGVGSQVGLGRSDLGRHRGEVREAGPRQVVVQRHAGFPGADGRGADDVHHGRRFGVGAADGADGRQFADPEGRDQGTEAT